MASYKLPDEFPALVGGAVLLAAARGAVAADTPLRWKMASAVPSSVAMLGATAGGEFVLEFYEPGASVPLGSARSAPDPCSRRCRSITLRASTSPESITAEARSCDKGSWRPPTSSRPRPVSSRSTGPRKDKTELSAARRLVDREALPLDVTDRDHALAKAGLVDKCYLKLVPPAGFEPALPFGKQILSLPRLPISPRGLPCGRILDRRRVRSREVAGVCAPRPRSRRRALRQPRSPPLRRSLPPRQ
jgi:hypothetical protein